MKLLSAHIKPGNLVLLAMAGGVGFLVFAAVQAVTSREQDPVSARPEDPYPFSLTPDFPALASGDKATLRSATAKFLNGPEWVGAGAAPGSWDLADLATVTQGGDRIGVYGEIAFQPPVSVPGPLTFIRCGQREIWENTNGEPFVLGGLHISLLDQDGRIH